MTQPEDKLRPLDALTEECATWREQGLMVVLVNGAFDVLHVGHLRYLAAARELGEIVAEYPDYAAARAKLVEAYLYQGLDFYSKGSLSAAIRVWRRALEFEPDNEKLQRYVKKAETEIDQIR